MPASFNGFKAPDLKNNSVGVGKGMPMGSLNDDPVVGTRDNVTALPAPDVFFFFQYVRFGFIFNQAGRYSIVLIFRWNTKPKRKRRIRYGHAIP